MFTGIVEQVGTITATADGDSRRRLEIAADGLDEVPIGASVAVNGVCLTVIEAKTGWVAVDVIPESLARTNLGQLDEGDNVNLERPLRADGRFDGHIVQGHVDGTGVVSHIARGDGEVTMTIEPHGDLFPYLVEKGSITIDGVSLTVAALEETGFSVALIPHTLEVTTLGLREAGDVVNLEVDVVAKYVERLLKAGQ